MQLTKDINLLTEKEFLSIFGSIFEKSQWIAENVFKLKPFSSPNDLKDKMINIFNNSSYEKIIEIFKFHPKLAIEKKLSLFSSKEQKNAKLNICTEQELAEFRNLNENYEKKFGFPFIIAVKGKDKIEILNSFRQRINNDVEFEFKEAKSQVKKIALFRLNEIFTK